MLIEQQYLGRYLNHLNSISFTPTSILALFDIFSAIQNIIFIKIQLLNNLFVLSHAETKDEINTK